MLKIQKLHVVLFVALISSSGCAALTGMMGGLGSLMGGGSSAGAIGVPAPSFQGLTDQGSGDLMLTSADIDAGKLGYVVRADGVKDPNADASYLYGLFKAR